MSQMGFFDVENRYAALDAKNDPLVKINAVVPWEAFRSRLENVWRKPADKRKSNSGCKPWDAIVMFKAIILCALYNLSDQVVELTRFRGHLTLWGGGIHDAENETAVSAGLPASDD